MMAGAPLAALRWLGLRAPWALALGSVAALFLPSLAAAMRPALPLILAMLYGLAMARMDLAAAARRAISPRRLARNLGLSLLLLAAAPLALWSLGSALGLGPDAVAALVYTGAAPPIGSSAGLCFLLGLDAVFALEMTVAANLLAPLVGPVMVAALLGAAAPLPAAEIALRIGAIIGAGLVMALLLRRLVGARRIERNKAAFDGLGAMGMLCFIVPLFDGVGAQILARPGFAAFMLTLAVAVNFGLQTLAAAFGSRLAPAATGGALGVLNGNRTVSLYLAALPADPAFGLYVALYQFPIYFTPLLLRRSLYAPPARTECDRT